MRKHDPSTDPEKSTEFWSLLRKRPRVKTTCAPGSSRTKQSFKDECDINVIVAKYIRTGVIDPRSLNAREAMFADVTDVPSYQEALNVVRAAQEGFEALPAKIRDRFENDPAQLLGFMGDPKNEAEAIELGLITGPETPSAPPSTPPTAPTAPPAPPK